MTLVLDGTNNTYLSATERGQLMTLSTAQTTTSGTSIDFTGIPNWAKKITVMFNGVSLNGTASILIQIGSGSVETTGYTSASGSIGNAASSVVSSSTTGFVMLTGSASNVITGSLILNTLGSNVWVNQASFYINNSYVGISGGVKTTSNVIDRIRITTTNGTDTFDAGSVNILIEGSL
jgi:hypothetical protein